MAAPRLPKAPTLALIASDAAESARQRAWAAFMCATCEKGEARRPWRAAYAREARAWMAFHVRLRQIATRP